jgi:hypothetical protein
MKTTTLSKYAALAFVNYLVTNWYQMTEWYKIILVCSSFITISGLIAVALGYKEIARATIIALPIGMIIFSLIKAGSTRSISGELEESSLLWFQYKETMSYGLKFLWHFGLDFLVLSTVIFVKYLPGWYLSYLKPKHEAHYH